MFTCDALELITSYNIKSFYILFLFNCNGRSEKMNFGGFVTKPFGMFSNMNIILVMCLIYSFLVTESVNGTHGNCVKLKKLKRF